MINKIYEKIIKFIKENYLFLIGIIFIIGMFYIELPYVIYKSGGIIGLNDRVKIDREYIEKGSINMSYVTAVKGTPAFVILSHIIPDWDLKKISDISSEGSYDDILEIGKEYLNEGINNAIISAFREANYPVNITNNYLKVVYISEKSNTDIKKGDIILKVNDLEINDFQEFKNYINSLNENDTVKLLVKNNNKEIERFAKIYKEDDGTLKIGVAFHNICEFTTDIPVKIDMKNNESGSSGGLMMSLQVYNALTDEDITRGLKIVGTGSINSEGQVEEIGGVKYKVLAANKEKADVFFCPKENFEEAIDVKNKRNLKMEIVEVETLKDVINYLKNKDL